MSDFNQTIKIMQDITTSIKIKAEKKLDNVDPETAVKINAVANRTIDVINEAAVKLKDAIDEISDKDELEKFLNRVEQKCVEAKNYAFTKIDELAPSVEQDSMEKYTNNENVENVKNSILRIKDSAVDFYNSPETQHRINEAKLAVLKATSKGLDLLKNALDKRNKEE